ncbi:MAG: isoleucine--tRNA ligase [Candidatus Nanoarchaeia archaeon]|nr:isoleucine--tRNA ligase [Candidatus Nanoarchaeia archaeon]MDD5357715.1 isoleucine--tRNA ligase [Candidatus Nanoarchaeia archaeon]MDD5588634.1 isoleucine--tRNA ligase [Candidatus Nanoarchaeia archaeon]
MYEFKEIEEKAREVWKKNKKEIEKAIQDNPKKPLFSFLEGPPTANAPPALHHLEVRTFKDIICKFKYMNGFSVPRKGGWDCHGLPVEVQVEKKLGLEDKKAIVKYGVDKFIKECRESVWSNIKDWNASTEELAYWVDLKNPYVTLENDYIESVWWSLKELYNQKMLYEGHKVVPFCPRCGTPLSSHEVAQGYQDVTEESVYIAFKVKGKNNEYILAWTTTPWTLPGNVALAVNPEIDYVKVKLEDGDSLILGKAKTNLIKGNYKIEKQIKGKDLVGIEYEPLYEIKELKSEKSYRIIPADFVTTEDGTGVVHTAVMYGEDDYNVGKRFSLPQVHTVGQDGKFLNIAPEFLRGRFVKEAEKDIKEDLKKRHLLFKVEKITHAYPFCWRCNSTLLYYGVNSWFIKVSEVRDRLMKLNKEINWEPEHIKDGRFGKWLEGAKDWAISRFKFWGTPLPIWKCECGERKIIGSVAELKENATKKISGEIDLHKPWIDGIKLKCKCGKEMSRIPDVIDCWYDSGSASFAQFHYPFENKKEFEKRFPYDFISEAIDQTRGWFYTLHVIATLLFKKPAYKNVICAGHVVDEKGEKMSKSKGNIIKPREIIDKTGVDAVRLQFCTTDMGNQKRFSYDLMKEEVLPFLTVLYNCHNYYNQLDDGNLQRVLHNSSNRKLKTEDKWILSRLNSVVVEVTDELNKFSLNKPFEIISKFVVSDFSRQYIKMTRDRDDNKKIMGEILEKVSLLIAPFAPYISEFIYQNFSKESVHLSSWPKADKKKIDKKLEEAFAGVMKIIETGLRERDKAQIGLKWPLASATIFSPSKTEDIEEVIKSQLNVKKIVWKKSDELKIELDTKLTPELEAEGYAREMSRAVQAYRKELGLKKENKIELSIFTDGELKKILDGWKNFIMERTNSVKLEFFSENVTTGKERFKNNIEFKIKDKRGLIVIVKK